MANKFDSLTKAEQRVVIAKDLIKRLNEHRFTAQAGTYLRVTTGRRDGERDDEVKDMLKGARCRGCQLGGIFLCAVDRHNKLKLKDMGYLEDNDRSMRSYLSKWFTESQLLEVEEAFEGSGKYYEWADAIRRDGVRMRLIAQNIIKNNGRFVGRQLLSA